MLLYNIFNRFLQTYFTMKNPIILFIFLIILTLTWCVPKISNILTFDQSLEILKTQSNTLIDKYSNFFDSTGTSNQDIKFTISSLDNNSPINIYIKSIMSLNLLEQKYTNLTDYDVNIFDNINNQKIISSWNFFYSEIEYIPYFKLNSFSMDMWTWNIENIFIKALLWWIIDKWIMIDIQDKKNLIQEYVDINYFFKDLISLSNCDVFYKIRNTIYKWKRAYKIWLNMQNIKNCIKNPYLDYSWIVFEWFLTPLNDSQIILEIKKLQLANNRNLFIDWSFDNKNININISNIGSKLKTSINIKYTSNQDNIDFKSKDYSYNIDISKSKDFLNLNWNITLITNNIKQPQINFNIKWNLVLQNTWYLDIKVPQNYTIMSQLLWDKFSLKNIIWQ